MAVMKQKAKMVGPMHPKPVTVKTAAGDKPKGMAKAKPGLMGRHAKKMSGKGY